MVRRTLVDTIVFLLKAASLLRVHLRFTRYQLTAFLYYPMPQTRRRLQGPERCQPEAGILFDNRLRVQGPVEPETRLRLHSRLGGRSDGRHRRRSSGKSGRARHRPDDRHVRSRRNIGGPVPGHWR